MSSINPVKISADPAVTPVRTVRPVADAGASESAAPPATSQASAERSRVAATGGSGAPAPAPSSSAAHAPEPASVAEQTTSDALQKQLDKLLATTQSALQFRVDEDADRLVVSVVDQASGDVLLQIPTDVALRIAKSLADNGQGLVNVNA